MIIVACSVPGCDYKIQDVSEQLAIALLREPHRGTHHRSTGPVRGSELVRPTINIGVSIEEWNVFLRRWDVFQKGSGINEASAPSQLFQSAGAELGDSLLKTNPSITSESLPTLCTAMCSLVVIPVATCVLRTELLYLSQERDEAFPVFAAKVRGKADTCAFNATCKCGKNVDYTDHVIRDVLLNDLSDFDIRREVLWTKDILTKPINDVIALVENKEMARNALPSATLSSISTFKQAKQAPPTPLTSATPSAQALAVRDKVSTCPDCKTSFKIFTEGKRCWNTKPHQVCIICYRTRHRKQRQWRSPQTPAPRVQAVESDPISQKAAFQALETPSQNRCRDIASSTHGSIGKAGWLGYHIFSKGELRRARLRNHPRVPIIIELDNLEQTRNKSSHHATPPLADVSAIVDTGAQSDLWALSDFLACGFSRDHPHPIQMSLSAANRPQPRSKERSLLSSLTSRQRARIHLATPWCTLAA